MNVGYKREYEGEAIYHFANMVITFAGLFPENAKLKAYAKQVCLKFIQISAAEIRDMKNESILDDRLRDCAECKRSRGEKPCMKDGRTWANHVCIYSTYEYNRAAIEKHFGEQGLQMLDYMERWITKKTAETEAMNGKQEDD